MDMEKSPAFQEFLKLLNENGRADQGQDLSLMAWYLDGMERQFDAVLQELQNVKAELAQVTEQQARSKSPLTKLLEALEAKVGQARERLVSFREKVMECAQDAVDRFKDAGVSALDSAITAMGVKKGLEHLQEGLQNSLSGIRDAIGKAEDVGHELRSVGGHLKNAGRAMTGKDTQTVDGGQEGRFQSAVLAPMRGIQKLLSNINNNTLAAIGVVEDLEQSADLARDRQEERAADKPGKRLAKKPSIRQALQKNQAEIAARSAPATDKEKKQEAAL